MSPFANPLLRFLAYCGNAEARELLPAKKENVDNLLASVGIRLEDPDATVESFYWSWVDGLTDAEWITGLIPLYLDAAPRAQCERMKADGFHTCIARPYCELCDDGKIDDPHALLRLAIAVGWAANYSWQIDHMKHCAWYRPMTVGNCEDVRPVLTALRAAEAWLEDPSEDKRKACQEAKDAYMETFEHPADYMEARMRWVTCPVNLVLEDDADGMVQAACDDALLVIDREALSLLVVELVTEKCKAPRVFYSRNFKDPEGSNIHYYSYHTILDCVICPECLGTGRSAK